MRTLPSTKNDVNTFFPAFDGLRAIAALLVLLVHASFVSGVTSTYPSGSWTARLEIGVSIFFLISGFLLYRPFVLAHLTDSDHPKTQSFLLKRLLRIVPAYWVALFLITSVFHFASIGPGGWIAYVTHYGFLQIYFWDQWINGITQSWSLCVEMTFYLFIPIYAFLVRRLAILLPLPKPAIEALGLVLITLISFSWRTYLYTKMGIGENYNLRLATHWLPAFLDLFALGMLLALMSATTNINHTEPKWCSNSFAPFISWGLACTCFFGATRLGISNQPLYIEHFPDLALQTLYGLSAFFLILPAVFGPQNKGAISRLLRCWPLASLGVVSYAFYLWHQAVITEVLDIGHLELFHIEFWRFFIVIFVITTILASISYFVLESPILKMKNTIRLWNLGRAPYAPNLTPDDPSS